jgi:AraC-like DNA-binding protein
MHSRQSSNEIRFQEKKRFYEGILDPETFAKNYTLRCYEPSDAMTPFVEHYFISRRQPQFDPEYIGYDVLSQPVVSLFIQPSGAFLQGPSVHKRSLRSQDSSIYVGAQFKPGGFHPFWQQNMSSLSEKVIPATAIIPELQGLPNARLTELDDTTILNVIDRALRAVRPRNEPRIGFVNEVVRFIEHDHITSVTAVSDAFAMSERTLQQLFHNYVGVGIKWVIMRARFLEVTKFARTQDKPDWTAIATDFGYSDQPHFIRDFKKIVGLSPRQYLKLVKSHESPHLEEKDSFFSTHLDLR